MTSRLPSLARYGGLDARWQWLTSIEKDRSSYVPRVFPKRPVQNFRGEKDRSGGMRVLGGSWRLLCDDGTGDELQQRES